MSLKGLQRKHHHVWRHYLTSWCTDNNIWYTTTKGKIANDSTVGLSRELDFYKVSFLTKEDYEFLLNFIRKSDKRFQDLHLNMLNFFNGMSQKYYFCKEKGLLKDEAIKLNFEKIRYEMLENVHTRIENDARPIIDALRIGDLSVLDTDQNTMIFYNYLGHQFTRTKAFRDIAKAGVSHFQKENEELKKVGEIFDRNWWFLSYFFGTNIGAASFARTEINKLVILVNNTDTAFITSDQTIINAHESLKQLEDDEIVQHFDLYYPISPKIAVMYNDSARYDSGLVNISESEVHEFNYAIASKSNENIYADSKELLQKIKTQLKARNKANKATSVV